MYFEDEILDYIELVRSSVPNAVEVFTKGNCGPFARMLMKTFPGGDICYDGHCTYLYNGQHYDIRGSVESSAEPIMIHGLDKTIQVLKPNYKG